MSWKLQQDINASMSNMDRATLASMGEYASAYDAVAAAGIGMNAIEEKFLKDIPSVVWAGIAGSIASAARAGRRVTFDLSRGFGYSASVSMASSRSDVAIVLQAPEVFQGVRRTTKASASKARVTSSARRKPAKRKPAAKRRRAR